MKSLYRIDADAQPRWAAGAVGDAIFGGLEMKVTAYRVWNLNHGSGLARWVFDDPCPDECGDTACQEYLVDLPEGYEVCETIVGDHALYDARGEHRELCEHRNYAYRLKARKVIIADPDGIRVCDAEIVGGYGC